MDTAGTARSLAEWERKAGKLSDCHILSRDSRDIAVPREALWKSKPLISSSLTEGWMPAWGQTHVKWQYHHMDLLLLLWLPRMEARPLGENCPWQSSGAGQSETRAALAQSSSSSLGSRAEKLSSLKETCFFPYSLHSEFCSPRAAKKRADSLQREFLLQEHIS